MPGKLFKQAFPQARLSLERATENVPDDDRFYLLVDGRIVQSFRSEKAAQAEYQKLRREHLANHPTGTTKIDVQDVIQRDFDTMSNKELIWGPEDFERLDRQGRRRR